MSPLRSPFIRETARWLVTLKRVTAIASLALAIVALQGFVPQVHAATTYNVVVSSVSPYRLSPDVVTINTGDTVHWVPTGTAPHTVTADGCAEPAAGACTFDSDTGNDPAKLLRASQAPSSFDFTFTQAGVYRYFCRLHGAPGGIGQSGVIVVQATNQSAPLVPARAAAAYRPAVSTVVYSPKEGQTIAGDKVSVSLGINGADVRAAAFGTPNSLAVDKKYGRYHLFLDTPFDPTTETNVGGTTVTTNSATLDNVAPGAHTLMVVWTYDNNISPQPPIITTVKFTTTAGASAPAASAAAAAVTRPVILPPSTGDGGLAAATPAGTTSMTFLVMLALSFAAAKSLTSRRPVTSQDDLDRENLI